MKRFVFVSLLLSIVAVLLPGLPAHADGHCKGFGSCTDVTTGPGGFTAGVVKSEEVPARKRATPEPQAGPGTWVTIKEEMVPACFGNRGPGDDALCAMAVQSCGEDSGRIRYWIWHTVTRWTRDENGNVTSETDPRDQLPGSYCLGDDDQGVPDYGRAIALVQRGFKDLPLPKADIVVAPAPESLIRVPTAFYAGGEQSFQQTVTPVPGISVTVTAKPTSWTWHWGDGTSQTFDTPGVPRRPVVAHEYQQARDFSAYVEVSWKGSFELTGTGQVFDIPTPAIVRSAPVSVVVREARSQLVDGS